MANLRANNLTGTGGRNALDGSVLFAGGDYLKITNTTAWDLSDSDFTIEYYYLEFNNSKTERRILYLYDSASAWMVGHTNDNSGRLFFQAHKSDASNVGGSPLNTGDGSNPNSDRSNGWHHVAVCRSGSNCRFFIDGSLHATGNIGSDSIRTDQNNLYIGTDATQLTARSFEGYLSNVRIVVGTALYTAAFTPPTEKLKAIDGTVLLCCQDSDNPLQEATGKTITAFGNLDYSDEVELVTGSWTNDSSGSGSGSGSGKGISVTGSGLSDRGVVYQTCTVVVGKKYLYSFRAATSGANCKHGIDSNDGTSNVIGTPGNNPDLLMNELINGNATMTAGKYYQGQFTATTTSAVCYFQEAGTGTFKADNISLKLAPNSADNGKNNQLPSVGVDEGVTFDGDTKVNTQNYMYFPTGDTASRSKINNNFGARGVIGGGETVDHIMYNTIATTGNAIDFGNLVQNTDWAGAVGSRTRGVWGGGRDPANLNIIQYITIASAGNATDFGDMTVARREIAGVGDETRGCYAGGTGGSHNVIDYITIATTGNAADFGDLTLTLDGAAGFQSPTRGVFAGGEGASPYPALNIIQYITIQSTGNAQDFGDLTVSKWAVYGCSSPTRGLTGGNGNVISYTTISSTGNAIDFGDLTGGTGHSGASFSSHIRGVFAIGGATNAMDYVTIATTGNGTDFGDTTWNSYRATGLSNGHGGLF